MGALHEGHRSLVRRSLRRCDRTVVSILVNPMQFGPREDFRRYPRSFTADRRVLARAGVHALFVPSGAAMYPKGFATAVEVGGPLTSGLCAPFRPGHFRGVATVVAKLFHIVTPHVGYFGQKDAQQAAVIQRMVRDLNLGLRVEVLPTVREGDGLAVSSRNRWLTAAERRAAPVLIRALRAGRAAIHDGARRAGAVKRVMRRQLSSESRVKIQYVSIVRAGTLQPVLRLRGGILLALATRLGRTRLIDSLVVRVPS